MLTKNYTPLQLLVQTLVGIGVLCGLAELVIFTTPEPWPWVAVGVQIVLQIGLLVRQSALS